MNTAKQYLGFDDRLFVLIGLPLTSFFIPQIFFQLYPWDGWTTFWAEWQQAFIFSTSFWALFRTIMIAMRKKYPGFAQAKRRIKKMILIYVLAVPVVNVIIVYLLNICSVPDNYEPNIYQAYLTTYSVSFAIIVLYEAIYFYTQLSASITEKEQAKQAQIRSELQGLRNQVNPHFLFNSLNVLTSLIDENPKNAQKFTTSLSKVYRYVLEQKNKDLVTVDEELDFAKTYMSLLKMRFEDSIVFEIPNSASNPESKVVPLSLQLLLENAVKHNMVTSSKPLHIKIYEEAGNLVILNNLQPKQIVKKSSGVGLNNIKQRYQLLTDKKVIINQQAKSFAVAIPMLTKQVSIMKNQSVTRMDDSYVRARKHVEELKEFYYSLISYVIIIPFLAFINYTTSWHYQWFWWPMLGWGIGLTFHAYKVFMHNGVFGRNWERKKIEEFMRDDENNRWN